LRGESDNPGDFEAAFSPVEVDSRTLYTGGSSIFRQQLPGFVGADMTIDKSLKVRRGASRNRSVLTRVERIARLREADKWSDERSPLGLPKVRVRKMVIKKKKKKKEDEEGAEGGAAKPAAGAATPAAGAKAPAAKAGAAKPATKPAAKK
jgi:small basic protein (TIGR04137 family)